MRPFEIKPGTYTAFAGIVISGGNTSGLSELGGGGIYNTGHLNLLDSSVSNNHALGKGGGVKNDEGGNVIIKNSTILSNTAIDGGGILNWVSSILTMTNSTVAWNTAVEDGGGIYNSASGQMLIEESRIISNATSSAIDPDGGGLYLTAGALTNILDSSINANTSGERGGGIYITAGAALTITRSTISGNKASLSGTGISAHAGGEVSITNSTLSGNQVTTGTLDSRTGGGGFALISGAEADIQFSTFVSNTTPLLSARGGIFITENAVVTMTSSIVANHIDDCLNYSTFTDGGYNLFEDGSCISAASSLYGDPDVGPQGDNGGKTRTHALLTGSKALDHIPAGSCTITEDQRGVVRPQGAGCDIGAYEADYHLLIVDLAGSGSGSVSSVPAGISCRIDCDESYLEGSVVTLPAATDSGSVFNGWSGACTGTAECVVNMDAAEA